MSYAPHAQRLLDPNAPVRLGALPAGGVWDTLATATVLSVDRYLRLAVHLDYTQGAGEAAAFAQMRVVGAAEISSDVATFRDLTVSLAPVAVVGGLSVPTDVEIVTLAARSPLAVIVTLVVPPVRWLALLFREQSVVANAGSLRAFVTADRG